MNMGKAIKLQNKKTGENLYPISASDLVFDPVTKKTVKSDIDAINESLNDKVSKEDGKGLSSNDFTTTDKQKLDGITEGAQVNTVTGVKGDNETTYREGKINITKDNIGLGNVDNTADEDKTVKHSLTSCLATKSVQDENGNNIVNTYEKKTVVDKLSIKVNELSAVQVNYIGYYPTANSLPVLTENGWAFVGELTSAQVYAYYSTNVPDGYAEGWNALLEIGTYDLTDYDDVKAKITELAPNCIFKSKSLGVSTREIEIEFISGYIYTDLNIGDIIDLTPNETEATTRYSIFECKTNDLFYINASSGTNSRLFCFVDDSNKVIYVSESNLAYNGIISTPYNAKKVIFNIDKEVDYVKKLEFSSLALAEYFATNPYYDWNKRELIPSDLGIINSLGNFDYSYPSNDFDKISFSDGVNGFLVYNKSKNKYEFITSSSDLSSPNILLIAVRRNNLLYDGTISSFILAREINKYQRIENKSFDSINAAGLNVSGNSVSFTGVNRIWRGTYANYWNGGTYTFEKNGFLIANTLNNTIRIEYESINIVNGDIVLLTYKNGKYVSGEIYTQLPNEESSSKTENIISNVYKRAKQLLTINWTALKTVASTSSTDGISEGAHIGIPYSSCMEIDKFVGIDVSLKTFMSAANNPYSLLYTEDLNRNISEYGFNYHNTGRGTIGGYFGIVCNTFVLYALGYPIPYDSGNFKYLAKKGLIKKLMIQDAKYLEIGDIIIEPGHCNVIIDVEKDSNGYAANIVWSESIQDFPISHNYSVEHANNRLMSDNGVVYRFVGLEKYDYYERSPFVAVADEVLTESYTYNNDICTFAGDYAAFRKGQAIFLNYNLKEVGNWTSIQLFKEDTIIGTYQISIDSNRYDLTYLNLEEGKYKACMWDGERNSEYTHFEIIDANIKYDYLSENNHKITFNSKQGNPIYVRLCKIDGGPIAFIPLTEDDIRKGYIECNLENIANEQGYSYTQGESYVKVIYSGEYGRVSSEYILTNM